MRNRTEGYARRPWWVVSAGLGAALALTTACSGENALGSGGGDDGDDEPAATTGSGDDNGATATTDGSGTGGTATVGVLVPLSGVFAALGEDMQQGFEFYLDRNDGRLGGREVTVTSADEGDGPDTGIPALQGLVADDVDAIVGIVNSAIALGVIDQVNEAEIPLIVANAGADALTDPQTVTDYVWRTSFANFEPDAAMGPYLAEECESVFLAGADYAAGTEHLGGFREAFTAAGGTIVGEALSPFGTTSDFQPFLQQIRQSGADCAFVFYAGAEAVAFTQQYTDFGLPDTVRLYSSGFLTEGGVLDAAGQAALGIQTSLHYSDRLDNPVNEEFVAAYTEAYGEPPTVYAVQAYDAAMVLDKAFAEGTEGPEVVEALRGIDTVDSPRGEWSFGPGQGPVQTYYLRTVEEADGRLVNTVVEELPAP